MITVVLTFWIGYQNISFVFCIEKDYEAPLIAAEHDDYLNRYWFKIWHLSWWLDLPRN